MSIFRVQTKTLFMKKSVFLSKLLFNIKAINQQLIKQRYLKL